MWLVELGELRDGSSVVDVVAATLRLVATMRPEPLAEVLVDCLSSAQPVTGPRQLRAGRRRRGTTRRDTAACLPRVCGFWPRVARASASAGKRCCRCSRWADRRGGDPFEPYCSPTAAAVPGFAFTEDNKATVAEICSRLDGLPLAIELAAARLRAMSPDQILERLADRYTLLTRGRRGAPPRQQTLAWSIGWSYDLCSPGEQQLWARLSVFAGSFELEAAEHICGDGTSEELLDLVSSLVDKSILIRAESRGAVRFRLLDTLRDYGREKVRETGNYRTLRRRHLDWYRSLTRDAAAEWFSSRQTDWIKRLDRELPNLREAVEFGLIDYPKAAAQMAVDLCPFWISHGLLGEGRRWLDRALDATPPDAISERVETLYYVSMLASLQGDVREGADRAREAREAAEQTADPAAHALADIVEGFAALLGGDPEHACRRLEAAVDACDNLVPRAAALLFLARAHELRGDMAEALAWNEKVLALSESHSESVVRTWALWSMGIESWRKGDRRDAAELLKRGLKLAQHLQDARTTASHLEVLAWIAAEDGEPARAVVMMAAAEIVGRGVGNYALLFPNLPVFHQECDHRSREAIGAEAYDAAREKGRSLRLDDAVAYALRED